MNGLLIPIGKYLIIFLLILKTFKVYGYKIVFGNIFLYLTAIVYFVDIDLEYIHLLFYLFLAFLLLKQILVNTCLKNNGCIKFSTILDFMFCDIFIQYRIVKFYPNFLLTFILGIILLFVALIYNREYVFKK